MISFPWITLWMMLQSNRTEDRDADDAQDSSERFGRDTDAGDNESYLFMIVMIMTSIFFLVSILIIIFKRFVR